MQELQMFRNGFDYIEIAAAFHTTEATVESLIHQQRTEERERTRKRENRRRYQREWNRKNRETLSEMRAQG